MTASVINLCFSEGKKEYSGFGTEGHGNSNDFNLYDASKE